MPAPSGFGGFLPHKRNMSCTEQTWPRRLFTICPMRIDDLGCLTRPATREKPLGQSQGIMHVSRIGSVQEPMGTGPAPAPRPDSIRRVSIAARRTYTCAVGHASGVDDGTWDETIAGSVLARTCRDRYMGSTVREVTRSSARSNYTPTHRPDSDPHRGSIRTAMGLFVPSSPSCLASRPDPRGPSQASLDRDFGGLVFYIPAYRPPEVPRKT